MAVVKKRNESTETRLLLESDEPVELPPAEIEESAVIAQFETFKPFIPELLDALREGTVAETVPVMMDGSTFVVHGATRSFWVKLWHSSAEMTRIERAQVLGCLPSTRGVQIMLAGDEFDDDGDFDDDEDFLEEDNDDSLQRE
ncbi:MAG: hypothetical protein M3R15_24335 [Acidobacteriota bacterium]|nr:hypothetical protein [Acidobacteriota bacterium]